jgi:multiple sugar transport system substrate-binding protein
MTSSPLLRCLLLLLLAALPACAERSEEAGVTLRFVSWKPNQPPVWDEALRRFEETHPGIRIQREIGPHSSTAFHDLLTQKLKNRDPGVDVFFMDVVWVAEFAAAGWALPLDDRFPPSARAEFLPGTIRANTLAGRIHGVPAFIDAGMLYYRKDLLEKYGFTVPKTWNELVKQARHIVEAERELTPLLVAYSGQFKQYEGLVCNMLELIASNGGELVDAESGKGRMRDPATLTAVRWVRERIVDGTMPLSVLTHQEPESLAEFLQGHAVFHRNWPYAWEVAHDTNRSRVAGKVGISPLPHFEGGESVAALGGWQYGISAFSEHPDEAWTFVSFMTSYAMQKYFALDASLAPTRTALYEDADVLSRNPRFADQAAAFRRAVPRPITPVYAAVSEALQRFFSEAIARPDSDLEALARAADWDIDRYLAMAREE